MSRRDRRRVLIGQLQWLSERSDVSTEEGVARLGAASQCVHPALRGQPAPSPRADAEVTPTKHRVSVEDQTMNEITRAFDWSTSVAGAMTTLVLEQHAFEDIVRRVILDRGVFATGQVIRRRTRLGQELIIRRWKITPEIPDGRNRPPLDDWAVVVTNFDGHIPVESLPAVVQPKRSHLLVAISLDPDDHRLLPVRIIDQGRIFVPDSVRFIGPGLLTLPEATSVSWSESGMLGTASNKLTATHSTQPRSAHGRAGSGLKREDIRASRTRGALRALHPRLMSISVLILGFGRGGNELSRQLVAAGIRHLNGVDGDRIWHENLDAAPDVAAYRVGEYKVLEACRRLRRNQPDLATVCVPQPITGLDASRLLAETRVDTAFSFVDNQAARLALSQACQVSCTLHLDIGTHIRWETGRRVMSADIRLFEPGRGCVACVPKMSDNELDDALYELSAPSGAMRRGPRLDWSDERAGSLLHLNALASSMAVETWLSYIAGNIRSSHWVRVVWPNGDVPRIEAGSVAANPECRFCRG